MKRRNSYLIVLLVGVMACATVLQFAYILHRILHPVPELHVYAAPSQPSAVSANTFPTFRSVSPMHRPAASNHANQSITFGSTSSALASSLHLQSDAKTISTTPNVSTPAQPTNRYHATNRVSDYGLPEFAFASVGIPPVHQSRHNMLSMLAVADGNTEAGPSRSMAHMPPPPTDIPDPTQQLGLPLGSAFPLLIFALAYFLLAYRRKTSVEPWR